MSVCVRCHPIYSERQTSCGRTSRDHTGGRSHRISPPSFCGLHPKYHHISYRFARAACEIIAHTPYNVYVRVCFLPIYSGRQACGRTSRGHTGERSHRISQPPSFCDACLNFSREKDPAVPLLSLIDYEVEFCVLTKQSFSACWAFFFFFSHSIP